MLLLELIKANKVIIGAAAGGAVVGAGVTEGLNVLKNKKLAKDNELRLELIKEALENEDLDDKAKEIIINEISLIIARKKLTKDKREEYKETLEETKEENKAEQKAEQVEAEVIEEEKGQENKNNNNNNNKNKNNKNNK